MSKKCVAPTIKEREKTGSCLVCGRRSEIKLCELCKMRITNPHIVQRARCMVCSRADTIYGCLQCNGNLCLVHKNDHCCCDKPEGHTPHVHDIETSWLDLKTNMHCAGCAQPPSGNGDGDEDDSSTSKGEGDSGSREWDSDGFASVIESIHDWDHKDDYPSSHRMM